MPILVVCHQRPQKLETLVSLLLPYSSEIYIWIDGWAGTDPSGNYLATKSLVEKYATKKGITTFISDVNHGVDKGVPAALNWVFEFNISGVIVIEDDCIPNEFAITYFNSLQNFLGEEIIMISGSSPFTQNDNFHHSVLSSYPLIWGWATSATAWNRMSEWVYNPPNNYQLLLIWVRNLFKNISISFFISAQIRVNRGKLKAWDAPIALYMLLNGKKSLVPEVSLFSNIGNDDVAHHTKSEVHEKSTLSEAGNYPPSFSTVLDEQSNSKADQLIEQRIYNLKFRQILSPLKALLT